jgi:hypothetical protein
MTQRHGDQHRHNIFSGNIELGTGHGDIKQTALFLDLRRIAGGQIRGDATIDEIQHVDRIPFLTLGRMDRRQDQIILVEPGAPSAVGSRQAISTRRSSMPKRSTATGTF